MVILCVVLVFALAILVGEVFVIDRNLQSERKLSAGLAQDLFDTQRSAEALEVKVVEKDSQLVEGLALIHKLEADIAQRDSDLRAMNKLNASRKSEINSLRGTLELASEQLATVREAVLPRLNRISIPSGEMTFQIPEEDAEKQFGPDSGVNPDFRFAGGLHPDYSFTDPVSLLSMAEASGFSGLNQS